MLFFVTTFKAAIFFLAPSGSWADGAPLTKGIRRDDGGNTSVFLGFSALFSGGAT